MLAVNTAVWETSTLLTFRLLVNETQRIARDPFLADRFREAIDKAETEPFRHFDLVRFVDRIGLRPLERVVLTSSILSAANRRDLVQQATSIIRLDFETARAALMNHPAFDSGDLTPAQVAKFVSNLLCDPPPDAPILDPTQRANLLNTISAKYGNEVVTSILKQVLPRIGLLPNTTLPQVLVQLGHELTTDPEVILALLQRFGLTDTNPPKDMQVLEVISRMARYAVEGHQLCDIGALVRALASYVRESFAESHSIVTHYSNRTPPFTGIRPCASLINPSVQGSTPQHSSSSSRSSPTHPTTLSTTP